MIEGFVKRRWGNTACGTVPRGDGGRNRAGECYSKMMERSMGEKETLRKRAFKKKT